MTTIIIIAFVFILVVGLITLIRRYRKFVADHNFAVEYREKFMALTKKYFSTYDNWARQGELDSDLYMWLTKNVNRIQGDLGRLGTMHYIAAFKEYEVANYQIIINTIPKFRIGRIQEFDVSSADDCMLRYIGVMEKASDSIEKKLRNPIIWFREGFQQILSLPLYILNWFGILGENTVSKVTTNNIFKIFAGIGGFVAFVSGMVTIIQGKEQTITFIKNLFRK
jgi:hypothetical protein